MGEIDINHDCYCTICGASAGALAADNARLAAELAQQKEAHRLTWVAFDALQAELAEAKTVLSMAEIENRTLRAMIEDLRSALALERSARPALEEVSTERDALQAQVAGLREALQGLHDDVADYARINNLGGFDNHWMKAARAALAGPTRTADQPSVALDMGSLPPPPPGERVIPGRLGHTRWCVHVDLDRPSSQCNCGASFPTTEVRDGD